MKRALLALVFALITLGCGGDEVAEPLSSAEYTAQGNAICDQMNAELDELSRQVTAGLSPEDERDIFVQANRVSRQAIDSLFALTPPASLVNERQSLLDLVEERRELIERMASGTDLNDELIAVSQQFDDEAKAIWPSCTT